MSSPATGSPITNSGFTGEVFVDALIAGQQWANSAITYSFIQPGASYYSRAYPDPSFWTSTKALSSIQQNSAKNALSAWSNVANLAFTQTADNSTTAGDIRLGFSSSHAWKSAVGEAYFPATGPEGGDVWLNPLGNASFQTGSYGFGTLLHEIGHALGLKHPFESISGNSAVIDPAYDSQMLTVMSYTTYPRDTSAVYYNFNPTTPMVFDIAAIQKLYGANSSFNAGNTNYAFNDAPGQFYFQTIWDGGGTNSITYTGNTSSTIDLRPGYGSYIGNAVYVNDRYGNHLHQIKNVGIAYGTSITSATVIGSGNNSITGNDLGDTLVGGSGIDTISGGSGDDSISGGDGNDVLDGGAGNDTFDWGDNDRYGNDTMYGGPGNDAYVLNSIDDRIIEYGNEGNDTIWAPFSYSIANLPNIENLKGFGTANLTLVGNDAANVLSGSTGNDVLIGGAGNDTAVYASKISNFSIAKTAAGQTVTDKTGVDGTDTLASIETIQFSDLSINTMMAAKAATISGSQLQSIVELYIAYFNRVPDASGLSYWIDQFKGGQTLEQIGSSFYNAAIQYSSLTGYTSTMSNADFVRLIYGNVLGRSGSNAPATNDVNYWANNIATGQDTRGTLIDTMLHSAHTFKNDKTWGWVADLLDNKVIVGEKFAVNMGLTYAAGTDSITNGMAIAAAITPTDMAAAIKLIGVAEFSLA